jgi:hypothetical protein
MKTKIIFTIDDNRYNDWKKGDKGYIDGYLANDGVPYVVIINLRTKRPVLVSFGGAFEVVN